MYVCIGAKGKNISLLLYRLCSWDIYTDIHAIHCLSCWSYQCRGSSFLFVVLCCCPRDGMCLDAIHCLHCADGALERSTRIEVFTHCIQKINVFCLLCCHPNIVQSFCCSGSWIWAQWKTFSDKRSSYICVKFEFQMSRHWQRIHQRTYIPSGETFFQYLSWNSYLACVMSSSISILSSPWNGW